MNQKVVLWSFSLFSLMKKHHKTTMKYATESVLNFRSDSLTQSECAVHSRTLKADLIISFHIFFSLFLSGLCRDVTTLSMPFFTSKPNTYRAQVGNSVILICQVENLGKLKCCFWVELEIISNFASLKLVFKLLKNDDCFSMNFNIFRKFCGLYLWTFSGKSSRNIDICPNTMSKVHSTMYNLHVVYI